MSGFVRNFHTFLCTLLNACISVKTSPINTKLGDFVNLGVLFLTMWINSCSSHAFENLKIKSALGSANNRS